MRQFANKSVSKITIIKETKVLVLNQNMANKYKGGMLKNNTTGDSNLDNHQVIVKGTKALAVATSSTKEYNVRVSNIKINGTYTEQDSNNQPFVGNYGVTSNFRDQEKIPKRCASDTYGNTYPSNSAGGQYMRKLPHPIDIEKMGFVEDPKANAWCDANETKLDEHLDPNATKINDNS